MADHKTTTDGLDTSLTKERVSAIAVLAVWAYSALQTVLASRGINLLPFTSDDVTQATGAVVNGITALFMWWHHTAVTEAGVAGKQLTTAIKNGSVALTQGTDPEPDGDPVGESSDGAEETPDADDDGDGPEEMSVEDIDALADAVFGTDTAVKE